ncbi:MAG: hypothetical protein JXB34_06290 [Bacteroidales bacterium]|nr:hypothetical protein [Bacteroidales bacterium]
MKVTIVTGSHRRSSQSEKVGRFIQNLNLNLVLFNECFFLNLAETNIPFWDEGAKLPDNEWKTIWLPVEAELKNSAFDFFKYPTGM